MGHQILVILGSMGSTYGVLIFFVGRHIFHTVFGRNMLQVGSTEGTLIIAAGVTLFLLGAAVVCIKLAMMLRVHLM